MYGHMKKIIALLPLLLIVLVGCFTEAGDPTPPSPPPSSGLRYYECDTFVRCGDGRSTYTTYTGCEPNVTAAVNDTIDACLADYYATCGGSVYCSTTCSGGAISCRATEEGTTTDDALVIE